MTIGYFDVVEVDGTDRAVIPQKQPAVRIGDEVVTVGAGNRGTVEPDLAVPGRRLRGLYLHAVPGIERDGVRRTEQISSGPGSIPEVNVETFAPAVVIHLPDIPAGTIPSLGQNVWGRNAVQPEAKTGIALRLGSADKILVETAIVGASGIGECRCTGSTMDHGRIGANRSRSDTGPRTQPTFETIAQVRSGREGTSSAERHTVRAAGRVITH